MMFRRITYGLSEKAKRIIIEHIIMKSAKENIKNVK